VKVKGEDTSTILVSLRVIKEQIRVPQITTKNKHVKKEIVERTEQMLALEEKTLSDLVDFSGVLVQNFDDVKVADNTLVLVYDNHEMNLPIQGDTRLIDSTITERFGTIGLKLETRKIALSELRNLQVIDFEKQAKLKDYIDDLVFALYFNIPLEEVGLDKAEEIQKDCSKSDYYQLL
jgi:hypothetical protein